MCEADAMMRDGFRAITEGWMLVEDWHALTDRTEQLADWAAINGPLLPDEKATVRAMIDWQIATAPMTRPRYIGPTAEENN
jgi:hypothetical protein